MLCRKLKSNRGMSILLALLVLFVCVLAGAAALTSAASNTGRYTHLRQDQQRYLAVSSAVRLMRRELCAGEYTASATLTETVTYRYVGEPGHGAWRANAPEYTLRPTARDHYTGSFAPWLSDRLSLLFQAQEIPGDWWDQDEDRTQPDMPDAPLRCQDLSLKAQDGDQEPLLSQVKWELELDSDYTIIATFWLEETEDGVTNQYYKTVLTIPASVSTSDSMTSQRESRLSYTITTQDLTVTWPEAGAVVRQS